MKKHAKKNYLAIWLIIIIVLSFVIGGIFIYSKSSRKNKDSFSMDSQNSSLHDSSKLDLSSEIDTSSQQDSSSVPDSSSPIKESSSAVESKNDDAIMAYSNLSYFKDENINRYIKFKQKNKKLSYEQAIVYVNIGLDRSYYTYTCQAVNYSSIKALVNKYSYLPSTYAPTDLVTISAQNSTRTVSMRKEAAQAFEKMSNDARSKGYIIKAHSTYRSYEQQKSIYNSYVKQDGQVAADTYSARPGFSEHQTGLVADVVASNSTDITDFDKYKENRYVLENAHKFGFIVRYPVGKENITGYKSEPWHLRYVGVETATKIKNLNITYDEYCAKFGC